MVQRNVERVTLLVLDMLYFAKERIPDITEVDMAKICSEIHQLYEKKFKDNRIKCTLDIDEIAPYSGDNKSLYTLLLTLTENAIDSCKWDSSKSEHEIIISLKDKDDIVILSVEDNGVGISEEAKSKMFTTMYSTKGGHGSGFGLMVVKKIVDEHSGKISVDSVSGIGAKFKVALIRKLK